ncbi:MAG: DUF507 family protein [Bdellovibrionales bacterium]|nr:DUF507 family protein [Bdellovibrionales bacterium]
MNLNELITLRLSELLVKQMFKDQRVQFQKDKSQVRKEIEKEIQKSFEEEQNLIKEVYSMMEDLERQGHKFERQNMFSILKNKLAKKKGIIL